jgi:DNA-binding MarR family transcriptional regulator
MANSARPDLMQSLMRELRRSSVETLLFHQAAADRLGINLTDLICCSLLELEGPLTAGKLAELTGLTTGAITGVVDRLEKAALVERATDPDDRRRVIVRPLPRRERDLRRLFELFDEPMANVVEPFPDAQVGVLSRFMRQANDALLEARRKLRLEGATKPTEGAQGSFSTPLGEVKRGRLEFARGAADVNLRGDRRLQNLYEARFEGPVPTVKVEEGAVVVQYRRPSLAEVARYAIGAARHGAEVVLNASIPWDLDMRGGLSRMNADLKELRLYSLNVTGGASEIDVYLGVPEGTVPVRVQGGASRITLHRPSQVPARVQVSGGASKLKFDDQFLGAVGGEVILESPGYKTAANRYEMRLTGGASLLTVTTTP